MQQLDGARCFQAMVPMRDGVRLNTFVFLPEHGTRFPVIVQRTPYGITAPQGVEVHNPAMGWLPDPAAPMRGSIKQGWREIVAHGYAAVYQDCRGRYGSEGEDHVYGDDAADGYDLLAWIASEPWTDGNVGLSGSSAGSTTALAAASQGHPSVRALFAQVGGSSIYDDVVYEGGSIELERLWLWVANNIPGLSPSHRQALARRHGLTDEQLDAHAAAARERYLALDAARNRRPPYVDVPEWLHLPLLGYPDFSVWQPYLDELLSHPAPDAFRAAHDFRAGIAVPGFHVTTWFDIFLTSVLAAFRELQARVGHQRLWIGPNDHYFVYERRCWPRDPYFEWFDHWCKGLDTPIVHEPAVFYSPRCWVADTEQYVASDWVHAPSWPPPGVRTVRLHLGGDGSLGVDAPLPGSPAAAERTFRYDPRHPVPSLGGRNMLITAGARDQRPVQQTEGYGLIYLGDELTDALTLAGAVTVSVRLSSDCPDTDVVAKLIERRSDGAAVLLLDGVQRVLLRSGATPEPLRAGEVVTVTVALGELHHTFSPGSRIEVDLTSSNFPRRARNTNSGNLLLAADGEDAIRVATNTIHHQPDPGSYVELQVR
ncbi:MAG: CocE/NonD family hydrolase [Acidimicrobiales bacterium]